MNATEILYLILAICWSLTLTGLAVFFRKPERAKTDEYLLSVTKLEAGETPRVAETVVGPKNPEDLHRALFQLSRDVEEWLSKPGDSAQLVVLISKSPTKFEISDYSE